ncbi:MAG: hypothetical protein ABW160_22220 [Candidatus Thiodiazotropha sp. 4PDIV1]
MLSIPCAIAIPVVVIDSPLYNVVHNHELNKSEIFEASRVEILWKHLVGGRSRVGMYIVNHSALSGFLADCKKSADWWLEIEDHELDEVAKEKVRQLNE